ncbi:MAG: methionine adenosyltransferase [Saprospiraceae bacterium]
MNNYRTYDFTSESVSEGHPDKVADQISDGILDAYLDADPNAKVACECLITTNKLIIAGEALTIHEPDKNVIDIAKSVLEKIGYNDASTGFDYKTADYIVLIHPQSPEINVSVADGGAGDQGLMFGYACTETKELMPMPITISNHLMKELSLLRKSGNHPWLRPDAKCQVTINYRNNVPTGIQTIVLSTQHNENVTQQYLNEFLIEELIHPVIHSYFQESRPEILINPSGSFTIGGPHGDTGLTGRKIIVDTYGGSCPHGGGAFSGKDPSKVDRSAAYAARYVAKHIVAAGLAESCTVQLSYAIGRAEPTSLYVNLHDNKKDTDELNLIRAVKSLFDLSPNGIINTLQLKRPIYLPTAAYGHFGNENYPWEKLDQNIIESLKNY